MRQGDMKVDREFQDQEGASPKVFVRRFSPLIRDRDKNQR